MDAAKAASMDRVACKDGLTDCGTAFGFLKRGLEEDRFEIGGRTIKERSLLVYLPKEDY